MAQIFVLLAIMVASCVSAFAQNTTVDYSGKWALDLAASKLEERQNIEAMTMTVTQTEKELKIETVTKRPAPPEVGMAGGRGGRGPARGSDGITTYSLDGKETSVDQESPMGPLPVKYLAKKEGSVLKLSQSRTINTTTMATKEEWILSKDGKMLTVKRERTTPRGTFPSTMVFKKS
jgi:hypothetical protein